MLNFLKLFAQLVIGLWPDRLLEFGEDHGVLARSMRLIHARECSHRSGKPFTVAAGAAAVFVADGDTFGERPTPRVLRPQRVDQRAASAAGLAPHQTGLPLQVRYTRMKSKVVADRLIVRGGGTR